MKLAWMLVALVVAMAIGTGDADARKRRAKHAAQPRQCTLLDFFNPACPGEMRWNRASPPVYVRGVYVGQDPDPFIRMMIQREAEQGYHKDRF